MWRVNGNIDTLLQAMEKRGLKLVQRLSGKGNRDAYVVMQDYKCNLGLFSIMSGENIDGELVSILFFERRVDAQQRLF